MRFHFIVLCLSIQFVWHHVGAAGLIEVFKWKQLEYDVETSSSGCKYKPRPVSGEVNEDIWGKNCVKKYYKRGCIGGFVTHLNRGYPRENTIIYEIKDVPIRRESLQANGSQEPYIPYNNIPMGVTHASGRLFVTVPRRSVGILSTLNYIDLRGVGREQSPKLRPYPDLKTNQLAANSKGLVSVYRTTADKCGRLWFVDTGMLQYPNNATQIQRPSIWIMDLRTNDRLRRYEIPESVMAVGRGLISLTVDVGDRCHNSFAYLPDLYMNQLHVYSYRDNRMWTFKNDDFRYDPNANKFNIAGQSFSWNDGVFSTTLGPKARDGSRDVFFHPMASFNEFAVSNKVLQDEAKTQNSELSKGFRLIGSRGIDGQSTMHEYDHRTGVVFFAEIQRSAIGCWNTKKQLTPKNMGTVAQNAEKLIYPSDLTIDVNGTMWVITNSMPIFIYSTLDPNAYPFRIWKQNTKSAVKNTKCI